MTSASLPSPATSFAAEGNLSEARLAVMNTVNAPTMTRSAAMLRASASTIAATTASVNQASQVMAGRDLLLSAGAPPRLETSPWRAFAGPGTRCQGVNVTSTAFVRLNGLDVQ